MNVNKIFIGSIIVLIVGFWYISFALISLPFIVFLSLSLSRDIRLYLVFDSNVSQIFKAYGVWRLFCKFILNNEEIWIFICYHISILAVYNAPLHSSSSPEFNIIQSSVNVPLGLYLQDLNLVGSVEILYS